MFFSIFLGKKNAEIIKFLGISKEMSPRIKNIFAQERKPMFGLKIYFCLSHNFQNLFLNTDHLLYYPQMSVFSFQTFFVL